MIVQLYKNEENGKIIFLNKDFPFDPDGRHKGFILIEEFEGNSWNECSDKIHKKYFNSYEEN